MIRKPVVTIAAPNTYNRFNLNCLNTQSPTIAKGIVIDNPTVTVKGLVNNTHITPTEITHKVMTAFAAIIVATLDVGGSSNSQLQNNSTSPTWAIRIPNKRFQQIQKQMCV